MLGFNRRVVFSSPIEAESAVHKPRCPHDSKLVYASFRLKLNGASMMNSLLIESIESSPSLSPNLASSSSYRGWPKTARYLTRTSIRWS